MSLTMIATCWNQRSLLLESAGIGRPRGVRYSVSSTCSSPSRIRTTRSPEPEHSLEAFVVRSPDLHVRDLLETENLGVKGDRTLHMTDGHPDAVHGADPAGR